MDIASDIGDTLPGIAGVLVIIDWFSRDGGKHSKK